MKYSEETLLTKTRRQLIHLAVRERVIQSNRTMPSDAVLIRKLLKIGSAVEHIREIVPMDRENKITEEIDTEEFDIEEDVEEEQTEEELDDV